MSEGITVSQDIRYGKPCVTGTRIPVLSVLELVREGLSFGKITQYYYPGLKAEDIRACLHHAIDVLGPEDTRIAIMP